MSRQRLIGCVWFSIGFLKHYEMFQIQPSNWNLHCAHRWSWDLLLVHLSDDLPRSFRSVQDLREQPVDLSGHWGSELRWYWQCPGCLQWTCSAGGWFVPYVLFIRGWYLQHSSNCPEFFFCFTTGDQVQVKYTSGTDSVPVYCNNNEKSCGFNGFRYWREQAERLCPPNVYIVSLAHTNFKGDERYADLVVNKLFLPFSLKFHTILHTLRTQICWSHDTTTCCSVFQIKTCRTPFCCSRRQIF